MRATEHH